MLRLTFESASRGACSHACSTLHQLVWRHLAVDVHRLGADRQQLDDINSSTFTPRLLAEQLRP